MAVSFVGAGTRVSSSDTAPLSVPLPSGISVGDYMILTIDAIFLGGFNNFVISSGGTWVFGDNLYSTNSPSGLIGTTYYSKIVEAGESALTVNKPAQNISRSCRIYAFTGQTGVSDFQRTADTNTTSYTPTISQPTNDGLAVVFTTTKYVTFSNSGSPPSVYNGWTPVDEEAGDPTLLSSTGSVLWYQSAQSGETLTAPTCTTDISANWRNWSWTIVGADRGWSIDTITY